MASLRDFVDRVRTLVDMPPAGPLIVLGTEPDDPKHCVLARNLGIEIHAGVGGDRHRGGAWPFAMRFRDRLEARRVGIVMDLEWAAQPPVVKLPDPLVDLVVADHFGKVEADDIGFLRGWWVPIDEGETTDRNWQFHTPDDPHLLPNGQWHLPHAIR